jgi:hypothetical protein
MGLGGKWIISWDVLQGINASAIRPLNGYPKRETKNVPFLDGAFNSLK